MIETNVNYRVEVAQGQTYVEQFTFSEEGTPMDFTGWTGQSAITDALQVKTWMLDVVINGAVITVSGETEQSETRELVPAGSYIFTMRLIDPISQSKEVFINGTFIVRPSAIRSGE